jgi:hypothetical protein
MGPVDLSKMLNINVEGINTMKREIVPYSISFSFTRGYTVSSASDQI